MNGRKRCLRLTPFAGSLELFGAKAFRPVKMADFSSQFQPRPKLLNKSFEVRSLEAASAKSRIEVVAVGSFDTYPVLGICV